MRTVSELVGGCVNVSNWNLRIFEGVEALLGKEFKRIFGEAVDEAIDCALGEKLNCGFGHEDIDKFNIWLPFDSYVDQFDGPQFSTSVSALVAYEIEHEDRERLLKLRANFVKMVRLLDDATKEKPHAAD
jgi:hypothetical protein